MSESIKSKVSEYYTDKLKEFGITAKGVDWNSEESQLLRFQQLCKVLPQSKNEKFSILDFGCGYGAMLKYLSSQYSNIQFIGYDISEEMIEVSKRLFKGSNAIWSSNEMDLRPVDYVIASGIFNVKMDFTTEDWLTYILKILHSINELALYGFSFNVLTSYSDKEYMRDNLFYADPNFLFDYCKRNFSKKVALLHDYPLYEFSVIVRK